MPDWGVVGEQKEDRVGRLRRIWGHLVCVTSRALAVVGDLEVIFTGRVVVSVVALVCVAGWMMAL